MRGHKGSLYMKKVERLIDDEIIDIFNNMLVTYCVCHLMTIDISWRLVRLLLVNMMFIGTITIR